MERAEEPNTLTEMVSSRRTIARFRPTKISSVRVVAILKGFGPSSTVGNGADFILVALRSDDDLRSGGFLAVDAICRGPALCSSDGAGETSDSLLIRKKRHSTPFVSVFMTAVRFLRLCQKMGL